MGSREVATLFLLPSQECVACRKPGGSPPPGRGIARLADGGGSLHEYPDKKVTLMTAPILMSAWLDPALAVQLPLDQEVGLVAAALVTVLGMWLCWHAPRSRMTLEERVKDGRISSEEARRRIARNQWTGPSVTIIGIALLAVVLLQ